MADGHIIELLDQNSSRELSAGDREAIESHASECPDCLRVYQAFDISGRLLSARAQQTIEPSPFFATRVMAALRESQTEQADPIPALWKPLRSLIASLVTMVVVLVALSIYVARSLPSPVVAQRDDVYSAEWVILDDGDLSDDVTDNQVLTTLYESPDGYGQDN